MLQRLGNLLMIASMLAAMGAHWTVLQSYAWTRMLADNLRTESLKEAVCKTLDGKHPCPLCKAIAAGKKSEKKSESSVSLIKFEFVSDRLSFLFVAPSDFRSQSSRNFAAPEVAHEPQVPPPRTFPV